MNFVFPSPQPIRVASRMSHLRYPYLDASRFVSLSFSELFPNPHKQLLSDYKIVSHLVSFPYPPQKRSPVLRSNIMNTIPSEDNSNRLPEITTTETHNPEFNSDDKQSIAIEKSIGKSSKNLVRKYRTDGSERDKDDGPKIKKSYKRKTSEHILLTLGHWMYYNESRATQGY